jgi:N,N-dimethylformamidase
MLPLAAYADRLSVRPGETIRFHVANATGMPVTAQLNRVISADANPAGPGVVLEPVSSAVANLATPRAQQVPGGSYARIPALGRWLRQGTFTFACNVYPTHDAEQPHAIAGVGTASSGVVLLIDAAGHLQVQRLGVRVCSAATAQRLPIRAWSRVWMMVDVERGYIRCGFQPLRNAWFPGHSAGQATLQTPNVDPSGWQELALAAFDLDAPKHHFNGKLERPQLWPSILADEVAAGITPPPPPLADWDFARAVSTSTIVDVGPHALNGILFNTPGRGMTGAQWDGTQMCFQHAPDHYGAIHFHEDDISDCQWPVTHEWTVPDDARSAVYALMLFAGDAEENVPFHVVPPRGEATARVAVLASTYTYTVYGNHARHEYETDPDWRERWQAQSDAWGCYPHNPGAHTEYGLSTYNTHTDGSGISIASWHRPMLNVRVGYLTYCDEAIRGSGLRHFPADSHLTYWLENQGIEYDVITDYELDQEGLDILAHYPLVMTGSHPEYHTPSMLDALQAYRDSGGRLMYLGGNGFYWKIGLSPERNGVVEIRRAEGGIRAWAAEPGEYYNQFDGEYGGLWRRNGRPPQHLTGVGFTAQGNFHGSYYRRAADADNPRASWILDGVDAEVLGNHGLSAHGAAGFELDRTDKRLGTPAHALVVARSENHPADAPWVLVPEEMLTHLTTWPGEPAADLIRADMTFFETPNGGAVFSTGSITFCGSLITNDCDNEISHLIRNVVKRFTNPAPFVMPEG